MVVDCWMNSTLMVVMLAAGVLGLGEEEEEIKLKNKWINKSLNFSFYL